MCVANPRDVEDMAAAETFDLTLRVISIGVRWRQVPGTVLELPVHDGLCLS